jgi:type 1 fimbriae regulatory protein FimB/type 1 fimbriae regulatory protein FimE
VEALIKAARQNRHGNRDALMINLAYHHALRVSELIGLKLAGNRRCAHHHG